MRDGGAEHDGLVSNYAVFVLGKPRCRDPTDYSDLGVTRIDKKPVPGRTEVRASGPKGTGGSGLAAERVTGQNGRRHLARR